MARGARARRARVVRGIAIGAFVALMTQVNAEGAVAVGSTVDTASPKSLAERFLGWVAGDDGPPEVPEQDRGTARGRAHEVPGEETRSGGGRGRPPGEGRNQLDPDQVERRELRAFRSGAGMTPGNRFDELTGTRRASQSTRTSDTFVDAAGRHKRVVSSGRVNYRQEDGSFARIDPALRKEDGRYRQKANDLDIDVAGKADAASFSRVGIDDNRSVSTSIEGAGASPAVVDGQKARYIDALPGVDVELLSLEDGLKETFILKSANAPTRFRFPLNLTGLTPRLAENGTVEYVDAEGNVAAFTPAGFMVDSNIDPRSGEGAWSNAVTYRLVQAADGSPVLEVVLDRQWVQNNARKFPIFVDPTTKTVSGDTFLDKYTAANRSTVTTLAMGTYDNGTHLARALFKFASLTNPPTGQHTVAASLFVFLSYQGTCGAYPFEVRPILETWNDATTTTYPGPALGAVLGSASPAPGAACSNSAVNPAVGTWVEVPLTGACQMVCVRSDVGV